MNRDQLRRELPEPVRRYFEEVARMNPPDDLLEAAIIEVESQPRANRFSLLPAFAAVAAMAVVAAVIAYGALGLGIVPSIGDEPSATPEASERLGGRPPEELQHLFLGPDERGQTARIRLNGDQFEFTTWTGVQFYLARAEEMLASRLQLHTISGLGCEELGGWVYAFLLSPGGSVLTVASDGEDPCAGRADALNGEWLRSDCRSPGGYCLGVLEAATYSSAYFEPRPEGAYLPRFGAMTYTVPNGWAAYVDVDDIYGLTPQSQYVMFDGSECYDCPGTRDTITVLSNPGAATEDCGEAGNVPGIGFGAEELLGWMQSHAGLVVGDVTETIINGRAARSFTITGASDWTGTCDPDDPFVAVPVFSRMDSYHWALRPNESYGVTLIDIGDGHTVAVVVDSPDERRLAALMADAAPIIATFDFPPR